MLWDELHPVAPDLELANGQVITLGDVALHVIYTPGHTPGSCCLDVPALGSCSPATPCSTVAPAPPAAPTATSARASSRSATSPYAIRRDSGPHGRGDSTVVGAEAPHRQEWSHPGH